LLISHLGREFRFHSGGVLEGIRTDLLEFRGVPFLPAQNIIRYSIFRRNLSLVILMRRSAGNSSYIFRHLQRCARTEFAGRPEFRRNSSGWRLAQCSPNTGTVLSTMWNVLSTCRRAIIPASMSFWQNLPEATGIRNSCRNSSEIPSRDEAEFSGIPEFFRNVPEWSGMVRNSGITCCTTKSL
jgi:hypothetical protein